MFSSKLSLRHQRSVKVVGENHVMMILVVDVNQRSRNLIDKNTTITNTLHVTSYPTIESADEHRSNLLGQIWAKGERIGVEATLEFIEEKQELLIISEEIAQRLKDLVKALTTRR